MQKGALIPSVAAALRVAKPVVSLPASRRAAVAVVLRPLPDNAAAILYILRQASERDPWSGQVGFPGGRRQSSDADDYAAALRECREEVGLELEDRSTYDFLGQLPDREITARGKRMADSALATFVFAQRQGVAEPPLALQASEIAAARWTHEACLRPAEVQHSVHRPYSLLPVGVTSLLPPALLHSVGLDRVSFPAVELCAAALPLSTRALRSIRCITPASRDLREPLSRELTRITRTACRRDDEHKLQREQVPSFTLWGITLGITSDLLYLAGRDPLDEPPIYLHNAALRAALTLRSAAGGEWEWAGMGRRRSHL